MWPNLNQKVRAVLPKPKLIVYIGRSQKSFRTVPQPEKKPIHFLIFISECSNSELSNSEFLKFVFWNQVIKTIQVLGSGSKTFLGPTYVDN